VLQRQTLDSLPPPPLLQHPNNGPLSSTP